MITIRTRRRGFERIGVGDIIVAENAVNVPPRFQVEVEEDAA